MKRLERNKCLQCGKECGRVRTKYCSKKCYGQYRHENNIRLGGPVRTVFPRSCEFCAIVFEPINYTRTQKFCSKRCMGLARADEFALVAEKARSRTRTAEERTRLSESAIERWKDGTFNNGTHGGGFREDLDCYFRSRWEANIARILKHEQIPYLYESRTFDLVCEDFSRIKYLPDFDLGDRFVEVKGWWDDRSLQKKKLMKDQHPSITIEYIEEAQYLDLESYYVNIIPKWEHKRKRRAQ